MQDIVYKTNVSKRQNAFQIILKIENSFEGIAQFAEFMEQN